MTTVLAQDIGFGDNKIVYGDSTGIKNIYKFPSIVASIKLNDLVKDNRVITHQEKSFYVGDNALQVQSSSIIDINNYDLLEYFSPIFIYHTLAELQVIPDVIVLGLSIAQIEHSGTYKKIVEDFLRKSGLVTKILVLPQGAVAKLTVDKYGIDFPNLTKDFNSQSNYILADIGFNTLDICQVINGNTSANLLRGIEGRGAMLIVSDLIISIKQTHGIELNPSEGKDVLSTGILKRRGRSYDVSQLINIAKVSYIDNLKIIIDNEFGDILNKVDNLVLIGGGSYILNAGNDDFVKSPKINAEYYNAIGYYLYGLKGN